MRDPDNILWHSLTSEEALDKLKSSSKGLNSDQVSSRLASYGYNELKEVHKTTALSILLSQFRNVMVLLLVVAAAISLLIDERVDAIVISSILVINIILGFIQEYKAERAMEALKSMASPKAIALRNGIQTEVPSRELVPGDIVVLNVGDIVPANVRLIESINFSVDQAHLTGESVPVEKVTRKLPVQTSMADKSNIAFMGSTVLSGIAHGVVCATGMNTEIGQIAHNVSEEKREQSPLQIEIKYLGKMFAVITVVLVTLIFLLGVIYNREPVEMLLTSVSLAVSAVPEGLPAVITITLALGMQRMASKNAIVRKLSAVQTLGSVTVICSDKTGTLTKNEMTVTKVFDGENTYDVTGSGYEPKGEFVLNKKITNPKRNNNLLKIIKTGVVCNDAYYGRENEHYKVVGDPTEGSLLALGAKVGISRDELMKEGKIISEISFTSERKMMSVVFESDEGIFVYSKGAPDVLLSKCSKAMIKGKAVLLSKKIKDVILSKNTDLANDALRVLALAYKKTKKEDKNTESDLIFLGLVGMIDPPRPEVKQAVELTKKAGIKVIIVTGDHKLTATAIASQLGLFKKDSLAFSGDDIDKMTPEEFSQAVDHASIFSRVSPQHKLMIVKELKKQGEVIAVTGDGVNDAPALKTAHIGIAMGIKGTDVSKEAAEMVLADDNFSTIVNAVEEGRAIFDNVKKFIKFLLASNIDTIIVVAVAILVGLPLPYLPLHILWMNLITDGFPAIALSVDSKSRDLMSRKPRKINKKLVPEIMRFILVAGLIDALASMTVFLAALYFDNYFSSPSDIALLKARTMAISSAIIYELFFVFNCRDDHKSIWSRSFRENFLSNKKLTLSVVVSLIFQLLFIYSPLLQNVFKTAPLTLSELGIVLFFSSWGLFVMPGLINKKHEE